MARLSSDDATDEPGVPEGAEGPEGPEAHLAEVVELQAPTGRWVWVKLGLPVLGVLAGLAALYLVLHDPVRRNVFVFLGAYILPVVGIDAGIPVGIEFLDLEPIWVLGLITYFDLWITAFWVWNLDHLVRFGPIADRVTKSRVKAHKLWTRWPKLRVASGPGLVLFILLPIPGTGSFGGVVIGKLIELPDLVIYVASILGTAGRVAGLAFGWGALLGLF